MLYHSIKTFKKRSTSKKFKKKKKERERVGIGRSVPAFGIFPDIQ